MAIRPITIDTIGALADYGYTLHACCETRGCLRVVQLDLAALIRERGAETPISAVKGRLRCSACGSRETSIRIIWAGAGGRSERRLPVPPAMGAPPSRGGSH